MGIASNVFILWVVKGRWSMNWEETKKTSNVKRRIKTASRHCCRMLNYYSTPLRAAERRKHLPEGRINIEHIFFVGVYVPFRFPICLSWMDQLIDFFKGWGFSWADLQNSRNVKFFEQVTTQLLLHWLSNKYKLFLLPRLRAEKMQKVKHNLHFKQIYSIIFDEVTLPLPLPLPPATAKVARKDSGCSRRPSSVWLKKYSIVFLWSLKVVSVYELPGLCECMCVSLLFLMKCFWLKYYISFKLSYQNLKFPPAIGYSGSN